MKTIDIIALVLALLVGAVIVDFQLHEPRAIRSYHPKAGCVICRHWRPEMRLFIPLQK